MDYPKNNSFFVEFKVGKPTRSTQARLPILFSQKLKLTDIQGRVGSVHFITCVHVMSISLVFTQNITNDCIEYKVLDQ